MNVNELLRRHKRWLLYTLFSLLFHILLLKWLDGGLNLREEPEREITFNFEKSEEIKKPEAAVVKEARKTKPAERLIPREIIRKTELPDWEIDPKAKVSMYRDSLPHAPREQSKSGRQLSLGKKKPLHSPTPEKKAVEPRKRVKRTKEFGALPLEKTSRKRLSNLFSNLDKYVDPNDYTDEGYVIGNGISFSFDDRGFSRYVWYGRIIKTKVKDGWFPPYVATVLGLTGRTVITFDIMKNGEVRELKIKEGSGNPSLDNASLNAVKSAIPFSRLPDDYAPPKLGVVFSFWYNLRPPGS
ncbi:MAG: energy transducer TonB [bacterium]